MANIDLKSGEHSHERALSLRLRGLTEKATVSLPVSIGRGVSVGSPFARVVHPDERPPPPA